MIVCAMGSKAKRVMLAGGNAGRQLIIDYGKGRYASMTQMPSLDFQCHVAWSDERGETLTPVDYFPNFIGEMLRFFAGSAPVAPREETLAVMALMEAAAAAQRRPGEWVKVPSAE